MVNAVQGSTAPQNEAVKAAPRQNPTPQPALVPQDKVTISSQAQAHAQVLAQAQAHAQVLAQAQAKPVATGDKDHDGDSK